MNKILLIGLLVLTACSDPEAQPGTYHVYIDPLTGCQYISFYYQSAIPRLSPDGKPICERIKRKKGDK